MIKHGIALTIITIFLIVFSLLVLHSVVQFICSPAMHVCYDSCFASLVAVLYIIIMLLMLAVLACIVVEAVE